jgi:hypothetical protein
MVPALTQEVARQGLQVLKEGLPSRQGLPHQVIRLVRPPQHRMEQQGEEIQRESHGGQVLLAMAVVMFAMIAFGCEDIVGLGLDVPAGSAGLHDGLHVGAIQGVRGRKRMVIQQGAVGLLGDAEFTPSDPQHVFTLAPGNIVGIPIGVNLVKATIPASDGTVVESSHSF